MIHAIETHPTSSLVSQLTSRTDDVVTCKINVINVCCTRPCGYNARCLEGNADDYHHRAHLTPKNDEDRLHSVSDFLCALYFSCLSCTCLCYFVFFFAVYIHCKHKIKTFVLKRVHARMIDVWNVRHLSSPLSPFGPQVKYCVYV